MSLGTTLFTGIVGNNYRIEYAEALGNTNDWLTLTTLTLTRTPFRFYDPDSATNPRRFYRVIPLP